MQDIMWAYYVQGPYFLLFPLSFFLPVFIFLCFSKALLHIQRVKLQATQQLLPTNQAIDTNMH